MRKALCLVFLGCALVVGLACSDSGDSTTPTAPAETGLQSVTGASAERIYLCHGLKNSYPNGIIIEVSDVSIKRHVKHLNADLDCECSGTATVGEPCQVFQDVYFAPTCDNPCPAAS